ncbi:MAG TPA: hypothetical protein PKY82_05580 [Pyrinomonadaceae bacterium]|nr:hypothetical protein [Pyrinomonadaceae bacterium]
MWLTEKGVTNSAGNLTLHLIGNLNHFIGAEIGKSGYIRHHDLEFSSKNTPKSGLLQKINGTIMVVEKPIDAMSEGQFNQEYSLSPTAFR